jgi:hypothetical protein
LVVNICPPIGYLHLLSLLYRPFYYISGSHFVKDALGNFVVNPMKDNAIDGAIDATGMGGLAASYTKVSKQGEQLVHLGSQLQKMFK